MVTVISPDGRWHYVAGVIVDGVIGRMVIDVDVAVRNREELERLEQILSDQIRRNLQIFTLSPLSVPAYTL